MLDDDEKLACLAATVVDLFVTKYCLVAMRIIC